MHMVMVGDGDGGGDSMALVVRHCSSVTHMCIGRAPKVRLGGCHRARAGLTNHCQSSIAKNVRTKKFLILFAKIFIIFTADQKP
jgi:hypothetical protein